ncbi:hypothetical protein ABIB57_000326 [Devosia sp. UYZn731]
MRATLEWQPPGSPARRFDASKTSKSFPGVRELRTVSTVCLIAHTSRTPYLPACRRNIVGKRSQGGVRFPTGGNGETRSPRAPHEWKLFEIRCSESNGGVFENRSGAYIGT